MSHHEIILFEVYDQRVFVQHYGDLPLLDRTFTKWEAVESAKRWGGVALKMWCKVLSRDPFKREVKVFEVAYVYQAPIRDIVPDMDVRTLRGKLNNHERAPRQSNPRRRW